MPEGIWLVLAVLTSTLGMGWLAMAFDSHWRQVHGSVSLSAVTRRVLRAFGALALAASLIACFQAGHPSMAPLVWVMALAVSAVLIAMILAWHPRVLTILAPRRS